MPIDFTCCVCGSSLTVDDALAGRQAKCLTCGELLRIPNVASIAGGASLEQNETPETNLRRNRSPSRPYAQRMTFMLGSLSLLFFFMLASVVVIPRYLRQEPRQSSIKPKNDGDGNDNARKLPENNLEELEQIVADSQQKLKEVVDQATRESEATIKHLEAEQDKLLRESVERGGMTLDDYLQIRRDKREEAEKERERAEQNRRHRELIEAIRKSK